MDKLKDIGYEPYDPQEYAERLKASSKTAEVKAWLEGNWDMSQEHECPRRAEGCPAFLRDKKDTWRDDRTCSFCGSMHPDDFMVAAATGAELGPTDKNYKVYVDSTKKFYFQHLNVEQKHEFIAMLNSQKIKIGEPGHFYVLPFFCKVDPTDKG